MIKFKLFSNTGIVYTFFSRIKFVYFFKIFVFYKKSMILYTWKTFCEHFTFTVNVF